MADYTECVRSLFEQARSGRFGAGLSKARQLDEKLGFPSRGFPAVHVAGTNGKGSVSWKIAATLQSAGKRVGLYTSPHLSCFRERIRIDGALISEDDVARLLPDDEEASFFERTTLLAFAYFAEKQVDCAVIETGLGGALDTTNIIERPLVCIITSISLDHCAILGSTVEQIAREKAGIIKQGVPVVIGPHVPVHVIAPIAEALNAPLYRVEGEFSDFDAENSAIALLALHVMGCMRPLAAVRPRCRYEKVVVPGRKFPVILDVAHNPEGMRRLFHWVRKEFPHAPVEVVCGFGKDKDVSGCLGVLRNEADFLHFTERKGGGGMPVEALCRLANGTGYPDAPSALQGALKRDSLVIVCGTFMIMGDIRASLGIVEARDDFDLNERRLSAAAMA